MYHRQMHVGQYADYRLQYDNHDGLKNINIDLPVNINLGFCYLKHNLSQFLISSHFALQFTLYQISKLTRFSN